ncbi:hypothetical protein BDP27DRAFT_1428283 [Rhodocollybia butyracea]|uniref:F-box domain-containing protein n=1 Tax=Rhodocollybia butyracea TaxID=206335 RepID=A0A9P5PF00_9AGAR|nr:hypothetical protein BDP27DRAFT_1428283 [Rhodocollybia butyracea]
MTINLPDDTISEILGHVVSNGSIIMSHCQIWGQPVPRLIMMSWVCRQWRRTVERTPSLWAFVNMIIYSEPDEEAYKGCGIEMEYRSRVFPVTGFKTTVARFLDRSGQHLLNVDLTVVGRDDTMCDFPALSSDLFDDVSLSSDVFDAVSLLTEQAYRWGKFRYEGPSGLLSLILSGHELPKLTEIDCRFEDLDGFDYDCFRHCFRQSPLKRFGLAKHITLGSLEKILGDYSPRLESLVVSSLMGDTIVDVHTWRNITSLKLKDWDTASVELLFSSLEFPSLKEAVFQQGYGNWPTEAFRDFVARSGCVLDTLILKDISLSHQDLLKILETLPGLQTLHIHLSSWYGLTGEPQCPITPELFMNLTVTEKDLTQSLIPHLKSLVIVSDVQINFDDRQVVTMVESRWVSPSLDQSKIIKKGQGCGIRSVVLRLTSQDVDLQLYQQLEKLAKQGLRVEVVGKPAREFGQSDSELTEDDEGADLQT